MDIEKMIKVYNNALETGVYGSEIKYTDLGIEVLKDAFKYDRWGDKGLPKYVKDLFPYIIKIDDGAFRYLGVTELDLPIIETIGENTFIDTPYIKKLYAPNLINMGKVSFSKAKFDYVYVPKCSSFKPKLNIYNLFNNKLGT